MSVICSPKYEAVIMANGQPGDGRVGPAIGAPLVCSEFRVTVAGCDASSRLTGEDEASREAHDDCTSLRRLSRCIQEVASIWKR